MNVTETAGKSMHRIAAIDWMRGIVMILMALDHTAMFFNNGRIFSDSVLLHESGNFLTTDQFFTRWMTHICAPTFIFLAGTGIAINTIQRQTQGISNSVIDRELLIRGAYIALLDLCILSLASGKIVLQVLYAIGVSMMLMVPLRRLGTRTLFIGALIILIGSELLLVWLWKPGDEVSLWLTLTFVPVFGASFSVIYPVVPWLAIMILGWVFGERLMKIQCGLWSSQRLLIVSGLLLLAFFLLIRSLDGYGNMFMYLEGNRVVNWLHVSKYPPSLAYICLELGLMVIILAVLMRFEPNIGVRHSGPVLVFGQTALFFYLTHFGVLAVLSLVMNRGGLEQTYLITLLVLIILYPICLIYRMFKWRYSQSILRFM